MSLRWTARTLVLSILFSPAGALLVAGDPIRYSLPGTAGRTEGLVVQTGLLPSGGEGWLVRPVGGEPTWLSKQAVGRLDDFREKGPWVKEGLLLGIVAGYVVLPMTFCMSQSDSDRDCWLAFNYFYGDTWGALTAGVGALVGLGLKPERWDTVISGKDRMRVSVAPLLGPRGRGVSIALGVGF